MTLAAGSPRTLVSFAWFRSSSVANRVAAAA
jgi:hypothetical protein